MMGAVGFITHLGNFWPEYPLRLWDLMQRKSYEAMIPELAAFKWPWRRWVEKVVKETGQPDLKKTLQWSKAVNRAVEGMVRGVPPFPYVRRSIEKLSQQADILVVSATPQEALQREWDEHDLSRFVVAICGQEVGTKKESLGAAAQYEPSRALMIGDAPGDYKAAQANRALFFPVNPGAEEASWKRFYEEGIERFFSGTFAGEYQDELLAEFDTYLPEKPPWPVVE